jgi:hypothetical protein
MSWFDRLFGRRDKQPPDSSPWERDTAGSARERLGQPGAMPGTTADEQAIARYRYMLQTAPPETLEQAHAEAFTRLTPEQRQQVLQQLAEDAPPSDQPLVQAAQQDPHALARLATRAEVRQPGTLERTFSAPGGAGMGGVMGGMIAGNLMASIAGAFIGTAIAQQFFADAGNPLGDAPPEGEAGADTSGDGLEESSDAGGDFGDVGGDFGGDFEL